MRGSSNRLRWALVLVVAFTVVATVGYDLLQGAGLGQSAALFIGLPATLALIVAFVSPGQSCTTQSLFGTVYLLLLSWIVFGEGIVCILMASPIFFAVAIATGLIADSVRARRKDLGDPRMMLLFLPFALLSLEGVVPGSGTSTHVVEVSRRVPRTVQAVERAVAGPLRTEATPPAFLRLGFPQPVATDGDGLAPGSIRRARFVSGETVFRVADSGDGWARFELVSDSSPIAGWMAWRSATVTWTATGSQTTVSWSVEYDRLLSPAWYFVPLEQYAVGLVGEYVLDFIAEAD